MHFFSKNSFNKLSFLSFSDSLQSPCSLSSSNLPENIQTEETSSSAPRLLRTMQKACAGCCEKRERGEEWARLSTSPTLWQGREDERAGEIERVREVREERRRDFLRWRRSSPPHASSRFDELCVKPCLTPSSLCSYSFIMFTFSYSKHKSSSQFHYSKFQHCTNPVEFHSFLIET